MYSFFYVFFLLNHRITDICILHLQWFWWLVTYMTYIKRIKIDIVVILQCSWFIKLLTLLALNKLKYANYLYQMHSHDSFIQDA